MRDIATATLSGNLTREVELRPLPSGTEVARLRLASGARRRNGEEWVERTNYFTVEVYGPQATLCAERLGKGSRVVVDGELDWREWTDQDQKRREAVVVRARQILLERTGSIRAAESVPGERNGSPDGRVRCPCRRGFAGRPGRRAVLIRAPRRLARPSTDGRAQSLRWVSLFFCADGRSSTCGRDGHGAARGLANETYAATCGPRLAATPHGYHEPVVPWLLESRLGQSARGVVA